MYGQLEDAEARAYRPRMVFVDQGNRVTGIGHDPAAALPGGETVGGDAVRDDPVRARLGG